MANSPLIDGTNLCSFEILSNGSEIPSTYEILSIRVDRHLNRIAEAEIVLRDGSPSDQTFEITDANTFKPGSSIDIKLGYHSKNDLVFKGIVLKQMIKIDDISGSQLHIICKDESLKLTVNRKNAIFSKQTDSAIMTKILGDYSISKDITSTTQEYEQVVQYYVSDWDFIVSRAEINGMIVYTDNGKLVVDKPATSASPSLLLTYGFDITEFDGEIDATYQYSDVQGNAWDISNQDMVSGSSSEPSVNQQGNITGKDLAKVLSPGTTSVNASIPIDDSVVKEWANAALLKSRLSRFKGTISFQGSSLAKVNSLIELKGLGSRFNGNAYVSGVTHTIHEGQWVTEVKMGLSAEWFIEKEQITAPEASGLLPGIKGLQTGIVQKMYEDPDNQFRVQVSIPILGAQGESVWARLATFYTGNSFGAYFMPEVGDEVILGFMNDDPRFPVIIGSVFSSKIPAPETPDEKNSIKTLVTQSKLQLKFDEENKVITLLTPGGNTLVISDEDKGITLTDQNSNKIQMNDSGIVIDSQSDLTLTAAQGVTIKGTTVSIDGSQSVSASGGTMSVSGDQTTELKGGASCAVSSSGEMSVKGATVMIN